MTLNQEKRRTNRRNVVEELEKADEKCKFGAAIVFK